MNKVISLFHAYKTKLMLSFFFVIVLTLFCVEWINYQNMRNSTKEQFELSIERNLGQQISEIELNMRDVERTATRLAGDVEVQKFTYNFTESVYVEYAKVIAQRMDNEIRGTNLRGIRLLDLTGKEQSFGYDIFMLLKQNEGEKARSLQIASINNKENFWRFGSLTVERTESMPMLTYVKSIFLINTFRATRVGVIHIDLNTDWLLENLQNLKNSKQGQYYITDEDGVVIFSEDGSNIGQPSMETTFFEKLVHSEEKKLVLNHNVYLMSKKFGLKNWYLVVELPRSSLTEGINRSLRQSIYISAIITLVGLIIALLLSYGITGPIKHLRRAMKQLELGNFETTIQVTRKDELGYLEQSFNNMSHKIKELISEKYQLELMGKEAEWMALQAQINPHFLYNALSSIDSLALIHGKENTISKITQNLASLFRYSINGNKSVYLLDEMTHIEQYLTIQKIRYGNRVSYFVDIDKGLESMILPRLLLQPLVENAIIHGIEPKSEGGYVNVQAFSLSETSYAIEIEDSGNGMNAETLEAIKRNMQSDEKPATKELNTATSIGLRNVYRRIELLYGDEGSMQITSVPEFGTVIRLIIPKEGGGRTDV